MASVIELAKAQFGQTVSLLKNTKKSLMSGEIRFEDIESLTGVDIEVVLIKKNIVEKQTTQGRTISWSGYILVSPSIDISDDDIIITQKEMFFLHEITLKHDNITGNVLSDPSYKRAEIELYTEL